MKRIYLVLAFGFILGGLATAGTAQTTTALSDVASFQATSSSPYLNNNATYGDHMAVNDGVFRFFHAGEDHSSTWWKVDLGEARDVDHLVLKCRHANDGPGKLNGATLMAFDSTGVGKVATDWVIEGFANAADGNPAVYTITIDNNGLGFSGVQYFQIGDTNAFFPELGLGVPYMVIADFQAYAEVPIYDTFIQGVTATANHTLSHPGVSAMFMVDHSGMTDQSTLLGDPTALHHGVSGQNFWVTNDNPPEQPVLTFDLGGLYDLDKFVIWGNDQNEWRQTKECLIEVSTDGANWTALADTNDAEVGNYTLTANDFSVPKPWAASDTISLDNVTASHVRMTLLSLYAVHPTSGASVYGLSEVRFYGTEATTFEPIPGDANNNGTVDDEDAKILAANWGLRGETIAWQHGDFNGDGIVDSRDAAILAANWGATRGEAATAVPEPSALALLLCGIVLAVGGRRRR